MIGASSTEKNPNQVYCVDFQGHQVNYHSNGKNTNNARLIRAFGNWTMGCMDSLLVILILKLIWLMGVVGMLN